MRDWLALLRMEGCDTNTATSQPPAGTLRVGW
jgi:hypothetical protein